MEQTTLSKYVKAKLHHDGHFDKLSDRHEVPKKNADDAEGIGAKRRGRSPNIKNGMAPQQKKRLSIINAGPLNIFGCGSA